MKIEVGKSYVTRSSDPSLSHLEWVFIIVAKISRRGLMYYVGVKNAAPHLICVWLFNSKGHTAGGNKGHVVSYYLIEECDNQKSQWSI